MDNLAVNRLVFATFSRLFLPHFRVHFWPHIGQIVSNNVADFAAPALSRFTLSHGVNFTLWLLLLGEKGERKGREKGEKGERKGREKGENRGQGTFEFPSEI